MSKLIKFPSQIKPDRVTMTLVRTDEIFKSPATGVQQVATRGNAFWKWSYDYKDLSLSERDILQAFLMRCQGSINTFKAKDPANYAIPGDISSWSDLYGSEGSFQSDYDSYFETSSNFAVNRTDDERLIFEWRNLTDSNNLRYTDTLNVEAGNAYAQRIKFFQSPDKYSAQSVLAVSSGAGTYVNGAGPGSTVKSSDCYTVPFFAPTQISSLQPKTVDLTANGFIGDQHRYADYRLARCALISNSENLMTRSNEFDHGDWTAVNAVPTSGGETASGVANAAWKLATGAVTNSQHYISQTISKVATEDVFTVSVKAKADELADIRIRITDNNNGYSQAFFRLNSGTASNITETNSMHRTFANIYDIGSSWYRCRLTALVSSYATLDAIISVTSATDNQFTGNGTAGVWIQDAQLKRFPFMGQYTPTVTDAVVGSSSPQVGSKIVVDGLDPETKVKAGTRLEIVNRFYNQSNGVFERSEFKRVTEEVVVHRDGHAILEIDPAIRNSPVTDRSIASYIGETLHNPVIFSDPELKGRLSASSIKYTEKPLQMFDVSFEVIEDLTE